MNHAAFAAAQRLYDTRQQYPNDEREHSAADIAEATRRARAEVMRDPADLLEQIDVTRLFDAWDRGLRVIATPAMSTQANAGYDLAMLLHHVMTDALDWEALIAKHLRALDAEREQLHRTERAHERAGDL